MPKTNSNGQLAVLQDRLKTGNLIGLYLFTGEEVFNKDFYVSRFKNAFSDVPMAEFNILTLDGSELPEDTLIEAAESYPVMADKKLVIIKNSGIFKKASFDKDVWSEIFKNPPENTVLIFDEKEIDGRSALLKKFKESGIFVEFNYLDSAAMSDWIKGYLLKRGFSAERDAAMELMKRAGAGMASIHSEMEKLIDYCAGTGKVTYGDVCAVVAKGLNDRVFDMIDCITAGDRDKAFDILSDLRQLREEPIKIISILGTNFTGILKAKILLNRGSRNLASELGVPPFISKKYSASAAKAGKEKLQHIIFLCLEADKSVKLGGEDGWIALETLMTQLSGK